MVRNNLGALCHVILEYHVIKDSVWWSQLLLQWRYNVLSLPPDLVRPRAQQVVWLCWWKLLIVRHCPAQFDDHKHCNSEDINISANTVILPQMRHIRYCICPFTSVIIIFSKPHGMSYGTPFSNSNFGNNFYKNLCQSAQQYKSHLGHTLPG